MSASHLPLSPFQQTVRDEDEKFFSTFPGARSEHFQDQSWHHCYSDGHLFAGSCFQLDDFSTLHYDYHNNTLPAPLPQSSLAQAVDPSLIGHGVQVQQNRHTTYSYSTPPYTSSPGVYQNSFAMPAPLPSPTSASDISHFGRVHQLNQHSPVMESLPSPGSSSDPSSFHGTYTHPPQQAIYHHPSLPFDTVPSPHHQSVPSSPPTLVHANPTPYPHPHEISERSDHLSYFSHQQPPSHTVTSSVAPSRRQGSHRAHRITPPYARPPNRRSGGTRGTLPIPNPNMGWSPSPPNVAGAFVNMIGGGGAGAGSGSSSQTAVAIAPVSIAGPPEAPPVSNSCKRNPDKKPALACVFCRGRKIACGPPTKDGDGKTCNQCQRRSLRCEYPTESRRGMRKKPSPSSGTPSTSSTPTAGTSKAGKSDNTKSDPKLSAKAETTSKTTTNKKR